MHNTTAPQKYCLIPEIAAPLHAREEFPDSYQTSNKSSNAPGIDVLGLKAIENKKPITAFDNPKWILPARLNEVASVIHPLEGQALDKRYRKGINIVVGLLTSYDHFQFNFKERVNTDQLYGRKKNFSLGIFGTFWPEKKIAGSISLLYATKSYYLDYNYKISNPDDPFPFPTRTNVCLSYMEFPVAFDYKFLRTGRTSIYLSAGFTTEIMLSEEENTRFLDGEAKTTNYFVEDHNKFLWGGTLGVKVWYNLNKVVSVFFKPDYVHYFTPVNTVIMDSNTQLLKLKAGLSLNINENK